jgi:hypothetical protein
MYDDSTPAFSHDDTARQLNEWQWRLNLWSQRPTLDEHGEVDYYRLAAVSYAQMIVARLKRDIPA